MLGTGSASSVPTRAKALGIRQRLEACLGFDPAVAGNLPEPFCSRTADMILKLSEEP